MSGHIPAATLPLRSWAVHSGRSRVCDSSAQSAALATDVNPTRFMYSSQGTGRGLASDFVDWWFDTWLLFDNYLFHSDDPAWARSVTLPGCMYVCTAADAAPKCISFPWILAASKVVDWQAKGRDQGGTGDRGGAGRAE